MADKRLDQVTKVTDMAYVPVIMADGSIGQIAKADLASVVAGYNKIKYKESSSAGNILEKRTMGFIFAYNTDNMEYYIGSYNNGNEQMTSHQKISGNLEISWFNQFGSFTIEGANKFIIIYIDK